MGIIKIYKPYIDVCEDKIRINAQIKIISDSSETEETEVLWYEVDYFTKDYLYNDRVDAFVVAILPYCMRKSFDVEVDNLTGISKDLYFQIVEFLIPTMAMAEKFNSVNIISKTVNDMLETGTGIATGISKGVDSFYTILKTLESDYKPDYLTLFNTQAYGEYGGDAARTMYERDLKIARELCHKLNAEFNLDMKILTVKSNVQDVFKIPIYDAGSFRDAGAILILKQMIRLYYFSTTISLNDFNVNGSCREFEPWMFMCLTTVSQRIQPVGADKRRIEKVDYISKFPITYNYLKVCRSPLMFGSEGSEYDKDINCTSMCEKCRCTALELYSLGVLDRYHAVFDLNWFYGNKKDLLFEVIEKKNQKGELDFSDIYKILREKGEIDDDLENEASFCIKDIHDEPSDRDFRILNVMNSYFEFVQSGQSVYQKILDSKIHKIGIYGFGRLGKLLLNDIKKLDVVIIDRKKLDISGFRPITERFDDLDMIIITTVYNQHNIKKMLVKKGAHRVVNLDEILSE